MRQTRGGHWSAPYFILLSTMAKNTLWKSLGTNMCISLLLFCTLLVLLWVSEHIWPTLTLLQWDSASWCIGIPASVIGVAYILTIRDPQNYTGFYAGIAMSILLGIQFLLQKQYDSTLLYFCIFIPMQIKSILQWTRPQVESSAATEPQFLSTRPMLITLAASIVIVMVDYLVVTYALQQNSLADNMLNKIINGLLIASSVMANYWLIYRKNDAWLYWVVYSIAGIVLFILINNIFSIVLFCFFLVINGAAGIAWIRNTKPENMGWLRARTREH